MSIASPIRPELARLDKIAQSPALMELDDHLLELIARIADEPTGLDALVARHVDVPNAIVPRAISFLLAGRATAPSPETWRMTLNLVGRLLRSDDSSTLINALTAIQRHLVFFELSKNWTTTKRSRLLDDFLLHCLEQSPVVRSTAIDVLIRLADDRLLTPLFGRSDVARLRRTLIELSADGEADRRDELDEIIASLPAGVR